MWRSPSMLEGPMVKVLPPVVVPQGSVNELEPLMVMGSVDPELVSVAVPVTVQFVDRLPEGSGVPVADSGAVLPLARKEMLPGTVMVEPPQVSVKVKLIV